MQAIVGVRVDKAELFSCLFKAKNKAFLEYVEEQFNETDVEKSHGLTFEMFKSYAQDKEFPDDLSEYQQGCLEDTYNDIEQGIHDISVLKLDQSAEPKKSTSEEKKSITSRASSDHKKVKQSDKRLHVFHSDTLTKYETDTVLVGEVIDTDMLVDKFITLLNIKTTKVYSLLEKLLPGMDHKVQVYLEKVKDVFIVFTRTIS